MKARFTALLIGLNFLALGGALGADPGPQTYVLREPNPANGIYVTWQWMIDPGTRALMLDEDERKPSQWLKGVTVKIDWRTIQPLGRDDFQWGSLDQFGSFDEALYWLVTTPYFARLNIYGTDVLKRVYFDSQKQLTGKVEYELPDWVAKHPGIQTYTIDRGLRCGEYGCRETRVVPWDEVFFQLRSNFVRAVAAHISTILPRERYASISVTGGAGDNEMLMLPNVIQALKSSPYRFTDLDIEVGMKKIWADSFALHADAFAGTTLNFNQSSIWLYGGTKNIATEIIEKAISDYGHGLALGNGNMEHLLTNTPAIIQLSYKDSGRVLLNGYTETPNPSDPKQMLDPGLALDTEIAFVTKRLGYGMITLHTDGGGVNPQRWSTDLKLQGVLRKWAGWLATSPEISAVSVGDVTDTSATISWDTDEPGNSQVDYGLTPGYGFSSTRDIRLVTSGHSVTLSGLAPGATYHFQVRSQDAADNSTIAGDFTFTTVDSIPPTATLTGPADGGLLSGSVEVSALASDNVGVVGVQFQLDGVDLGPEVVGPVPSYSMHWDTALESDGVHVLVAIARDESGNFTASAPVTVNVDNSAPVISGISSEIIADAGVLTVVIKWVTNEDASSIVRYGKTPGAYRSASRDDQMVTSHSITLMGLTPGTRYYYRVRSRDAAGNLAHSEDLTFTMKP